MREKLKEFGILVIRTIGEWAKGFAAFSVSRSKPIDQAAFDDRTNTLILAGSHQKDQKSGRPVSNAEELPLCHQQIALRIFRWLRS